MAVYQSPGDGRVLIALADGPLVAEPTWTRYDNLGSTCRCHGFDVSRGRQSEFDVTDAGTARVYFHDRNQTMNDTSLIGLQIMLQLFDPVVGAWQPCFRGTVDNIGIVASPNAPELANVQVDCVDVFGYLSRARMIVGTFGDTAPATVKGSVFYEDGPVATGTNDPDDGGRIEHLFADAGLASTMYVAFSGNVNVNESLYDPQDTIREALLQAADAEFPGIANVYVDRFGRAVFHGRLARFDPDTTAAGAATGAWDFHRWAAATREDVGANIAQIREFSWNIPMDKIINTYLAWPGNDENGVTFDQANIATLQRSDATSISDFGYCGIEKAGLIIKEHKTNGNTGTDECGLFGDFFIANYPQPKLNIDRVTFTSVHPDDDRAAATWELMTKCDVSDIIALTVDEAGVAEDFYVEGIELTCRPLNPDFDFVEFTPNLSPFAYYTDNVFDA